MQSASSATVPGSAFKSNKSMVPDYGPASFKSGGSTAEVTCHSLLLAALLPPHLHHLPRKVSHVA